MAKLLTPEQLIDLYDDLSSEQLFNSDEVRQLRFAISQNISLVKDYQPTFDLVVDLIDDYRNQECLKGSGHDR